MAEVFPTKGDVWADRYRIERFLGQGERKRVYLATDLKYGRAVALSLVAPEPTVESGQMTVTEWESEVMAQLGDHSPNVVTFHDYDEYQGHTYMTTQLMSGGDLRGIIEQAHLDETPVSLDTAVRIAADICEALIHAHGQGIVHRDIQPGNVWLDSPNGKAHLGDFDLAISTGDDRSPPPDGRIVTTRAYMPPEQARGELFNEQSDLYSLGATLYELCTGRPPFEGADREVIEQHLMSTPRPPAQLRPEIPGALNDLILWLLEKKRDDRPPNAEVVADAIASIRDRLDGTQPDVAGVIASGESRNLEFKGSLRFDLKKQVKNTALQRVAATGVAALMNTAGGTLVVGVGDHGEIIGIEHDINTLRSRPTLDGWEQALTNAIIKYLGKGAAACAWASFASVDSRTVAVVRCLHRSTPTWLGAGDEEKVFYVRIGNSSRELSASDAKAYIAQQWPNLTDSG